MSVVWSLHPRHRDVATEGKLITASRGVEVGDWTVSCEGVPDADCRVQPVRSPGEVHGWAEWGFRQQYLG